MARRDAFLRVLVGIVYLPLYYFVLYPLAFAVGIVLTAVDVLFTLVTGRRLEVKPRLATRLWEGVSQGVTWVFSGRERDKPRWVP